MSFTDTTNSVTVVSTLGAVIPLTFPFTAAADLVVTNVTQGTTMAITTHYTVTGGGRLAGSGGYDTGSVTLVNPAVGYTVGDVIEVLRVTPKAQTFDFANHSALSGPDLESALDRVAMVMIDFGIAVTRKHSVSTTLTDLDCRGGVHIVTAAATLTLPDVQPGMSLMVHTIGDIAVSVDPNASDKIYLDGTALDDGDKATNSSTAGDVISLAYYDATGWLATSDGWTDGG